MNTFDNAPNRPVKNPFTPRWNIRSVSLAESADVAQCQADLGMKLKFNFEMSESEVLHGGPWLHFGPASGDGLLKSPSVSSLHRRFAAIAMIPKAILRFAEEYGALGTRTYTKKGPHRSPDPFYESVLDWYEEIHIARILIAAMDLFRSYNTPTQPALEMELRKRIDSATVDIEKIFVGNRMCRFESLADEWNSLKDHFPTVDAAVMLVEGELDHALASWCTPRINLFDPPTLEWVSECLVGAVYGSLVQECLGDTPLPRQCAGCGSWYIPDHGRSRHCSDSCKTKAYRRRKKVNANG